MSESGIYAPDLSDPARIPPPTLLIPNAINPAIMADGGFVAFSQGTLTRRDLVVQELSSGVNLLLSRQPEGRICDHPAFDETGITWYFSCFDAATNATEYYRYDIGGLRDVPISGALIGRFDARLLITHRVPFEHAGALYRQLDENPNNVVLAIYTPISLTLRSP